MGEFRPRAGTSRLLSDMTYHGYGCVGAVQDDQKLSVLHVLSLVSGTAAAGQRPSAGAGSPGDYLPLGSIGASCAGLTWLFEFELKSIKSKIRILSLTVTATFLGLRSCMWLVASVWGSGHSITQRRVVAGAAWSPSRGDAAWRPHCTWLWGPFSPLASWVCAAWSPGLRAVSLVLCPLVLLARQA